MMYIEKNVFYTEMNVKRKSKDNIKARKDDGILCYYKEIAVPSNSTSQTVPRALYILTKEQRSVICEWLQNLRFPDGYASNLGKCAYMNELKMTSMKSHDYHVFMKRLIPVAFKEMSP